MSAVLEVKDLTVGFATSQGFAEVIHGVSFTIERKKTLCIVGESGSGKSVTCHAVLGLLPGNGRRTRGEILFHGRDFAQSNAADFHVIEPGQRASCHYAEDFRARNDHAPHRSSSWLFQPLP